MTPSCRFKDGCSSASHLAFIETVVRQTDLPSGHVKHFTRLNTGHSIQTGH
jgi:hypothetical protein